MTLRNCLVFALIAAAAGAVLGRAAWRDAPSLHAAPAASSANLHAAPAGRGCKDERADLASTKAQLALCMALRAPEREAAPSSLADGAPPDPPESSPSNVLLPSVEEVLRNRELLDSYPEAVIVQHYDGTTGVYRPDEWPSDGDGDIVARKLPSGRIAWYAGPDAGPRSDPGAFRTTKSTIVLAPNFVREADGSIRVRQNAPDWLKRRLERRHDGNMDEPPEP